MSQIIDVPGQGQVEFPDGMTDDQIIAAIKANSMPTTFGGQLGRQLGLTARAGADALGAIPNAIADPLVRLTNVALRKIQPTSLSDLVTGKQPYQIPIPSQAYQQTLNKYFPEPANGLERFSNVVASGMAQPAILGSAIPSLAANMGTQIAAAGAGAGSSDLAKEAGLGPMGQFAAGTIGGLALPTSATALGTAAKATGRIGSSIAMPLTDQGRRDIVARVMQRSASNAQGASDNIQSAQPSVPGVKPTTAELANDAGLSGLYKALRNQNTPAFSNVEMANDAARQAFLQSQFGSPVDIALAKQARDAATGPMRQFAFSNAQSVDTAPIVQAGTNALEQGAKYRGSGPLLQKFVNDISGITDPQVLYNGPRKAINDAIAGKVSQDSPLATFTKGELISLRNQIDNTIEASAPGFKNYLSTYADMSRGIDAQQLGQDITQRATNPASERLSPAMMARQIQGNAEDVAKMGAQGSDALYRVNEDLKRSVAPFAATRVPGSDTLQNMVGNDMLQRVMGYAPGGITGRVASKVASVLYSPFEAKTKELLLDSMINPDLGREMLLRRLQERPDLIAGLLSYRAPITTGGLLGAVSAQ